MSENKEDGTTLLNHAQVQARYGVTRKTIHSWRKTNGFPDPIPSNKFWRLDALLEWERPAV